MYELTLNHGGKAETYRQLLPQLAALMADETDLTANLANIAAVLKQAFGWLWVGFYRTNGDTLVLGPFQGPLACTRIPRSRGVCGQAWAKGETLVMADVNTHPDHIACSSLSQSEIVVPVFDRHGAVMLVLDADADRLAVFDDTDAEYLQQLAQLITRQHG